jgi:ubiquinone/menaquinone biosynthesis C-methylase UbiE
MGAGSGVERYDRRASSYESGFLGGWHAELVRRATSLIAPVMPTTGSLLDVGCGSGALLRSLRPGAPEISFVGVDPSPAMLRVAVERTEPDRGRTAFVRAYAEALPCRQRSFDIVVSSVSFGHWRDQRRGLQECRRVLVEDGSLVLVDVFSRWLNMVTRRGTRHSVRAKQVTSELLRATGFDRIEWHGVFGSVIGAFVAS